MRNISRLAHIKEEMEEITKQFQALGGIRGPPQAYDKMQKQLSAMYEKHDCNPMRSIVSMIVQVHRECSCVLASVQARARSLVEWCPGSARACARDAEAEHCKHRQL